MSDVRSESRKRLLLLLSPNTYRASAFLDAADRLSHAKLAHGPIL